MGKVCKFKFYAFIEKMIVEIIIDKWFRWLNEKSTFSSLLTLIEFLQLLLFANYMIKCLLEQLVNLNMSMKVNRCYQLMNDEFQVLVNSMRIGFKGEGN